VLRRVGGSLGDPGGRSRGRLADGRRRLRPVLRKVGALAHAPISKVTTGRAGRGCRPQGSPPGRSPALGAGINHRSTRWNTWKFFRSEALGQEAFTRSPIAIEGRHEGDEAESGTSPTQGGVGVDVLQMEGSPFSGRWRAWRPSWIGGYDEEPWRKPRLLPAEEQIGSHAPRGTEAHAPPSGRKRPQMKPKPRSSMTPAELPAAGETVYGRRWRTPLAEALCISARMIRHYERGERPIPEDRATRIRKLADLGPIGFTIRASIRKSMPDLPLFRCHQIAARILADLTAAGWLASNQQTIG
jgi:hypothetical protein